MVRAVQVSFSSFAYDAILYANNEYLKIWVPVDENTTFTDLSKEAKLQVCAAMREHRSNGMKVFTESYIERFNNTRFHHHNADGCDNVMKTLNQNQNSSDFVIYLCECEK